MWFLKQIKKPRITSIRGLTKRKKKTGLNHTWQNQMIS